MSRQTTIVPGERRRPGTPSPAVPPAAGEGAIAGLRCAHFIEVSHTGCWLWIGARDANGYGRCTKSYGHQYAHRLVYTELRGPIPQGLQLDHLCRVRRCVNPDHLEPVTQKENSRRSPLMGMAYRRRSEATHCVHGHPRTPDNLYVAPNGHTACKVCKRATTRRWRARQG